MHEHQFAPSDKPNYSRCSICGTYNSDALLSREALYENNYWSPENGRSTMEEQVHNLLETQTTGISKVGKVLGYMMDEGRVLEIGCAPGVFLKKAIALGHKVEGIEPDKKNINSIKEIAGHSCFICEGYFPDVFRCKKNPIDPIRPYYDYIVALDVLEHVANYEIFVKTAYDLLVDGGKFIFMSPIIYEDGKYRDIDFIGHEHANIFTIQYIRELLRWAGFSEAIEDRWQVGHEIIIAIK